MNKSALQTNAYFYPLSGHLNFRQLYRLSFRGKCCKPAASEGKGRGRYSGPAETFVGSDGYFKLRTSRDKPIQTISDLECQYDFPSLVAGDYSVTVEISGFKKYEKKLSVRSKATVEHDICCNQFRLPRTLRITDDRSDAG
jgi:hypothetical protein